MRRFLMVLAIGILSVIAAQDSPMAQTAGDSSLKVSDGQYEVL